MLLQLSPCTNGFLSVAQVASHVSDGNLYEGRVKAQMTDIFRPQRTVHDQTVDVIDTKLLQTRGDALVDLVFYFGFGIIWYRLCDVLTI